MESMATPAKVDWSRAADAPLKAASAFVSSVLGPVGPRQVPEGISLIVAEVPAPILLGTQDENLALVTSPDFKIEANVLGRYFITRERAGELIQILNVSIQQYDALIEESLERNV